MIKLQELTIRDKAYFNRFLRRSSHSLAVYAFPDIYIWKALFKIFWAEINGSLCVFFEDAGGCFLYLPPLGGRKKAQAIEKAFEMMDRLNDNSDVSRIENVEETELGFYQNLGYSYIQKSADYVSAKAALVELKGDKFKAKRGAINYFTRRYQFEYLPLTLKHRAACLKLTDLWIKQRRAKTSDSLYQALLADNRRALEILFREYSSLDCVGRIVKVNQEIKGFTLGYGLNEEIFCVLYEITDLTVKGLAQFIFREFVRQLPYSHINMMDDSGLANLQRVKLSYHPAKIIPSYIIKRKA